MLQQFLATRAHLSVLTARELFEGAAGGDPVYLFDADAYRAGLHPLREVFDHWTADDNGRVCLDFGGGPVPVDPDTPLVAEDGWREEPVRTLGSPVAPPATVDLVAKSDFTEKRPCSAGGEVGIVRWGGLWLCAWRRDARTTRDLTVVSAHGTELYAKRRLGRASEFEAPARARSRRLRDSQRERVYRWEGSFGLDREPLGDIDAVRSLVERVCRDLGSPPPTVKLGRTTLESCSYHQGGNIVMSASMLDTGTALHETAHHLAEHALRRTRDREAAHGPMFCGILAGLYAAYAGADLEAADREAQTRGVAWNREAATWVFERATTKLVATPAV